MSRFDEIPENSEILTRFLFQGEFARSPERVKPKAFLPEPTTQETSVSRTVGLDENSIQKLGQSVGDVRMPRRTLRAWGDILAGKVFEVGLRVRPDNMPERHAAIIGWPDDEERQMSVAQELAADATLHILALTKS